MPVCYQLIFQFSIVLFDRFFVKYYKKKILIYTGTLDRSELCQANFFLTEEFATFLGKTEFHMPRFMFS